MAPRVKPSHYTIAQVARVLGISYNRMRPILERVPKCIVVIEGTKMISAEHIDQLKKVQVSLKRVVHP